MKTKLLFLTLALVGCEAGECHVSDLFTENETFMPFRQCNVRWSQDDLPLMLIPEKPELLTDLRAIVPIFNDIMGLQLVTLDERSGQARVRIKTWAKLDIPRAIGTTQNIYARGMMLGSSITLKRGVEGRKKQLLLLHELGHVFAMKHTSSATPSIMDAEFGNEDFLDEHVAAMRRLYGGE